MTAPTFIPPQQPDIGAQATVQPRVLRAQFGDGYSQRSADGLNTRPVIWSLTWGTVTDEVAQQIVGFFEAREGVEAFRWLRPDATSLRIVADEMDGRYLLLSLPLFVCETWSETLRTAGERSVSARFRQEFDLGV